MGASLFTPARFPDFRQLADFFRMLFGEVGDFGAFLGEVVERPRAAAFADDLVVAFHHCVGVGVVEKVGMVAVARFAPEQGNERLALVRKNVVAAKGVGVACARELEAGGHQVDDMTASG